MDQERFDKIALAVSRRRVLGGTLAGLLGVGAAKLADVAAKGKKNRGAAEHKKNRDAAKRKKGKGAGAEFLCVGDNSGGPIATNPCPPGSCCATTPAGNAPSCVDRDAQLATGTLCGGTGDGNGVCRTCPVGTRCVRVGGFTKCECNAATCPNGCCIKGTPAASNNNDQCIPNGSGEPVNTSDPIFNGRFVCGTAGSICNTCGLGTIFSGCCTATGACNAGTAGISCGSGGHICQDCTKLSANGTCGISQNCTGATTTAAPTTTTTTTTLGPCADGRARCTTALASVCCAGNFKCSGSGCVRKRRKRR